MKLVVIGGGGVRAPFLAKSLVKSSEEIGVTEIVFMDNNVEKLNIFGNLSKKVAQEVNPKVKFSITSDVVEAVKNADFVVTTIRSGGDACRVFDEKTALDLGVLGQETTGFGGFAMALRSVPVLIDLCEKIKENSNENVLLFNFTNPSGIVTQALRDEGYDFVFGICDAPSGFQKQLVDILEVDEKDFEMTCFGLNHLSWFRDFKVNGEDVHQKLINNERSFQDSELRYFGKDIIDLIGSKDFPNEYLYFYYYRNHAIDMIMKSGKARGEVIQEINSRMIDTLSDLDIETQSEEAFRIFIQHYFEREDQYFSVESGKLKSKKRELPTLKDFAAENDAGGYAGVAIEVIKAFSGGEPSKIVLSVPNNGCLDFLEDNDVIEVSCIVEKNKVTPVVIENVDDYQKNLISTVKFFERQTVKAIKNKDRDAALKGLMLHPQINSHPLAVKLLDACLERYKDYFGEWK